MRIKYKNLNYKAAYDTKTDEIKAIINPFENGECKLSKLKDTINLYEEYENLINKNQTTLKLCYFANIDCIDLEEL